MKVAVFALALAGCSVDEPCSLEHRQGTYLQRITARGGDCIARGETLESLSRWSGGALPWECSLDAPDELSADSCQATRSVTCATDDGGSFSVVGVTTEHEGGELITGIMDMTIRDEAGAIVCSGTFDLESVRQ